MFNESAGHFLGMTKTNEQIKVRNTEFAEEPDSLNPNPDLNLTLEDLLVARSFPPNK